MVRRSPVRARIVTRISSPPACVYWPAHLRVQASGVACACGCVRAPAIKPVSAFDLRMRVTRMFFLVPVPRVVDRLADREEQKQARAKEEEERAREQKRLLEVTDDLAQQRVEVDSLQAITADLTQELNAKSRELSDTRLELSQLQESCKGLQSAQDLELATSMLAEALHAKMVSRAAVKAEARLRRRTFSRSFGGWIGLVWGRHRDEAVLACTHVAARAVGDMGSASAVACALVLWRNAARTSVLVTAAKAAADEAKKRAAELENDAKAHQSESQTVTHEAKVLSRALLADVEHQRDCLVVAASVQEKSAEALRDKTSEVLKLKHALQRRTAALQQANATLSVSPGGHERVAGAANGGGGEHTARLSPGRWGPVDVIEAKEVSPGEATAEPLLEEDGASAPAPPISTRVGATVGIKLQGLVVSDLAPKGPAALSGQIRLKNYVLLPCHCSYIEIVYACMCLCVRA